MGTPCDWRGLSNVQCNEVMAHRMVWWSWVGAVPMCPPVSPCKGAFVVHSPRIMRVLIGMETPLRGRSGRHIGAAPTVSFGGLRLEWLISFGWIVRKWLFCLCGIAWKNMMKLGRGHACVPARVAPQGRIHRSRPRGMMRDAQNQIPVWKRRCADVRAGTQAPPLRFRWMLCVGG